MFYPIGGQNLEQPGNPRIFDLAVFSTGCEDAIEHLLEYAKCKLLQM